MQQIQQLKLQKEQRAQQLQELSNYRINSRILAQTNISTTSETRIPIKEKSPKRRQPIKNRPQQTVYDDILEGYYGKHSEIKPVKSAALQSRNFTTSKQSGMEAPAKELEEPEA